MQVHHLGPLALLPPPPRHHHLLHHPHLHHGPGQRLHLPAGETLKLPAQTQCQDPQPPGNLLCSTLLYCTVTVTEGTPMVPAAPLRVAVLHAKLPLRQHFPQAAHRHQVPPTRCHGHRSINLNVF